MSNIEKSRNQSAVFKLADHLAYIGVNITEEEIQFILLYEYKNQQYWQANLYEFNRFPSIYGGRVVKTVAVAAVGFLLAPVLGVSAVAAAVVGASIGWKLTTPPPPPQPGRPVEEPKIAKRIISNPGFDTSPPLPSIGGAIPVVFSNETDGIRLNGSTVYSRVRNINNVQYIHIIQVLALGNISGFDGSKMLINNQETNVFNIGTDFIYQYYTGEPSSNANLYTPPPTEFLYDSYSQSVVPNNNFQFGISYLCTQNWNNGVNVINVPLADINLFTTNDTYALFFNNAVDAYIKFYVDAIDYSNGNMQINIIEIFPSNTNLAAFNNNNVSVYRYSDSKYNTSKRCNKLSINLELDVWKRLESDLVDFAVIFSVEIDGFNIRQCFYVDSKSQQKRRLSIEIINLPYDFHVVTVKPFKNVFGDFRRLFPSNNFVLKGTGVFVNGQQIIYEYENNGEPYSSGQVDAFADMRGENIQTSADSGNTGRITSFNEMITPEILGHPAIVKYNGLALFRARIRATERLQGSFPSISHFVTGGLRGRLFYAAGKAGNGSNGNLLNSPGIISIAAYGSGPNNAFVIKNIRNGITSVLTNRFGGQAISENDMQWRTGDDFVIYSNGTARLENFPDIYVHILTSSVGFLGSAITDRFIDFPSIINALNFVIPNGFRCSVIIENSVSVNEWLEKEAAGSLLICSRNGGKYGLIPETNQQPVAVFTSSNILKGKFSEKATEKQRINTIQLTYRAKQDIRFYDKTITCMLNEVASGQLEQFSEAIKFDSIVNENQAVKVAQLTLKSRRIQDRIVEISTGIQGFSIREGQLIIVQYGLNEYESEVSGFVVEATEYDNGNQMARLSRPIANSYSSDYRATIYYLRTGRVVQNLPFTVVNGMISFTGLDEGFWPPTPSISGDIIIITNKLPRKIYKVIKIEPEAYEVKITGIYWNASILDATGITTLGTN